MLSSSSSLLLLFLMIMMMILGLWFLVHLLGTDLERDLEEGGGGRCGCVLDFV